jgi:uncharacterized protein YegJ (DUF2314 family)
MRFVAGFLAVLFLAACSGGGEEAAFRKAMAEATAQAQARFDAFWASHEAPAENEYDFRVKIDRSVEAPLTVEGGGLWVEDVAPVENGFTGRASAAAGTIAEGDPVSFTRKDVRDWSFVRGEELIGHYTTRVLLPKLPPEQAEALKSMFGENPE